MPDNTQQGGTTSSILNRLVVVITPFFALLAGSTAAYVSEHIPGVQLDPTQITALMVAIMTAALTMAVKWLHGWQRHEAALRQASGVTLSTPTAPPLVAVTGESTTG